MKKFGKFLLFLSAAGAAFAGAYYYLKNKDTQEAGEDDYEDLDDDSAAPEGDGGERTYVSLTPSDAADAGQTQEDKGNEEGEEDATAKTQEDKASADAEAASDEKPGQRVEEYFDDDDDDSDNSLDAI